MKFFIAYKSDGGRRINLISLGMIFSSLFQQKTSIISVFAIALPVKREIMSIAIARRKSATKSRAETSQFSMQIVATFLAISELQIWCA